MSYAYTNGDGLAVLNVATPNGATEPVSVLDDAVKQIKAYLKDPVEGPDAKLERLSSDVRVIATITTVQDFAAGDPVAKISLANVDLDSSSNYNNVLYRFLAPDAGLYMVVAQASFTTQASSAPTAIMHTLDVYVDGIAGARSILSRLTDVSNFSMQVTRIFNLSASQTLDLRFNTTVGSGTHTVRVVADPLETIFQVTRFAV